MTDDELLKVYFMGVGSGAGSTLMSLGMSESSSMHVSRRLMAEMNADPAVRHTVLSNVRRVLAGEDGPDHTVMPASSRRPVARPGEVADDE